MNDNELGVYDVWVTEQVHHRYFVIANSEAEAKRIARENHVDSVDQSNVAWIETDTGDGHSTITASRSDEWYTDGGTEADPEWENEPIPDRFAVEYSHACRRHQPNVYVDRTEIKVIDINEKAWEIFPIY